MPRVLIVDLAKRFGGATVRVLEVAKSLHGHAPYAVATLAGSPLHRRLEAANLVSLPVPFSPGDPRILFLIWRAIHRGGYRVVDAHNVQSQFWGHLAGKLAGAAVLVSTVHGAHRLDHMGSFKGRAYEQVLRLNAWWGCRFVAVSDAIRSYLLGLGVPQEKIFLIGNGLGSSARPSPQRDLPLLKSLGWDHNVYIVVIAARLEPVKGHAVLIEALSRAVKERPQLRCLIAGEGRMRAALETQVEVSKLHDRVHFTGFSDDIPALLRTSDAFCLPSLSEGMPYALLEACAHCLPLLVTEVGGMADILTHKRTAFLVPPGDPAALAEGLCWLIDHPNEAVTMAETAYDLLRRRFSPDEMIAKTLALYRQ